MVRRSGRGGDHVGLRKPRALRMNGQRRDDKHGDQCGIQDVQTGQHGGHIGLFRGYTGQRAPRIIFNATESPHPS